MSIPLPTETLRSATEERLVDGTAEVAASDDGKRLMITPEKAVLHRPAAAPNPASDCSADCVPLLR
jgi:hypothetical protein